MWMSRAVHEDKNIISLMVPIADSNSAGCGSRGCRAGRLVFFVTGHGAIACATLAPLTALAALTALASLAALVAALAHLCASMFFIQ